MVASSDAANNQLTIVFDDAGSKTVVKTAGGLVATQTYNLAGELIARMESSEAPSGTASTVLGADSSQYDDMGRLAVFTDARGDNTYYVYDALGRQTAVVTQDGWMTQYRYDEVNNVIATARFTAKVSEANLAALADPNRTLTADAILPTQSVAADISQDIWTWSVYDEGSRLVQTINGEGAVTNFEYDKANNLVRTIAYWEKVAVDGFKTNPPLTKQTPDATPSKDIVVRNFFDMSVARTFGTD